MPELTAPGPVAENTGIREAVCIHTKKIYDSCRDKDCIEDLRLYPTRGDQAVIDRAISVKAGRAELLYAYIDVEPVGFNRGFYTVDVRYFYRVTADAFVGASRPVPISGLAVFDKRAILFGSEGAAKIFSSESAMCAPDQQNLLRSNLPTAVVEAVIYAKPLNGTKIKRTPSIIENGGRYSASIQSVEKPVGGAQIAVQGLTRCFPLLGSQVESYGYWQRTGS